MKAIQRSTTVSGRRRFLRLAGAAAAATAFLSAPALAVTADADKRFLTMIARTRALVERYLAAQNRATFTYEAASADPEMPEYPLAFLAAMRERGSLMSDATLERMRDYRQECVFVRHGYHPACAEWNAAGDLARPAIERAMASRPNTIAGALAKWRLAELVHRETDIWEADEIEETVFPALVADLRRLAKGGVA